MKSAFAALFFLLSGIYFLTGAALCNPAATGSAQQSEAAFTLSNEAGELYAVAPVNFTVPDKLRGKRRDGFGESSLASAFVLCALTAVIAAAFYKIFLMVSAHLQTRLSNTPNSRIPFDAFKTRTFALLI